ncbi:Nucleotidyltransferase domain protein [uncultured archaeon]|nr:Nucleotidyltransferase domain protein [uncultured archaeon]
MQLIENLFGSRGRIKVLKELSRHKGWWFNLSELSKDMVVNKGALSKILDCLEKENLVVLNRKGKIKLFRLNEESIFVIRVVLPAFKLEEELFKDIKQRIIAPFSKNAISIILYGSYAKGTEKLQSDIDVMVITKRKCEEKCKNIANKLSSDFLNKGLLLRADVINENDFKKIYLQREPSILSIVETGVAINGRDIRELVK